jgi:hypothetical protein
MARNRKAALRSLTDEQGMFLRSGTLLVGSRGESVADVEQRLFGTRLAAAEAWFAHRDALAAEYPTAGTRCAAFWRYERHRDVPPVASQPALLRSLGLLTELEEAQLAKWARMTPELPADIALDRPSVSPISIFTEDPTDVDEPTPQAGSGSGHLPIPTGRGDEERADQPAVGPDDDPPSAVAHPDPPERPLRARKDDMSGVPWPLQLGRRDVDGWETEQ